MKQVTDGGSGPFPWKKKEERGNKTESEGKRDENGRLRVMTKEQAKRKGVNKDYKAQSKTIPHFLFPRGNPELQSLNKGEGGYGEMPGTLLRNE